MILKTDLNMPELEPEQEQRLQTEQEQRLPEQAQHEK
jgi:hypothetical protein